MTPNEPAPGVCPSCDLQGSVGDPCQERVCQKRGYAFIPAEHLQAEGERDPYVGRLIGDCLLVSLLGEGGFGKVFLALQQPLMMKVALKRLRIEGDTSIAAVMLKKFEGEARALAQLGHPNIVRLIKYGTHEGAPYLVMEYIEGGRTLQDDMDAASPPPQAAHILRQLLDGLEAAHSQDLIHRDIKPENIMLQSVAGNEALVRILDFGLAKSIAASTATSMAIGTPIYMAPEQLDMRHLGPWTDLYAVGVIVFEMLCGRSPFPGDTHVEIIARKLDPLFDPVEALEDTELDDTQRSFLKKALARDIEARFKGVPEFREALEGALTTVTPTPEPTTVPLEEVEDTLDVDNLPEEPPRLTPRTPTVIEDHLKRPPPEILPTAIPKPPTHTQPPGMARGPVAIVLAGLILMLVAAAGLGIAWLNKGDTPPDEPSPPIVTPEPDPDPSPPASRDALARDGIPPLRTTPPNRSARRQATSSNTAGFKRRKDHGDNEGAWSHYRKAVRIDPSLHTARYNLACEYALRGEREAALTLLEQLAAASRRGCSKCDKVLGWAKNDEDFDSIRREPRFERATREGG